MRMCVCVIHGNCLHLGVKKKKAKSLLSSRPKSFEAALSHTSHPFGNDVPSSISMVMIL